ncbi:MAG: alpha-E domain-containing protein, partial [Leptospiraceae bacterium]|nr:alpha-E domain-containing protein [Leptospiraceae bacterium]
YHFMRTGKYMERADQIARILDVKYQIPLKRVEDVGNPLDIYQWKTLLDSTGSYEAYIKNYSTKITPIKVAELLVFNRHLPRSLYNSLEEALVSLRKISPVRDKNFANTAEQKIGKLFYNIAYTDINEVFFFGLHEYLTNFINDLITVGIEMNYAYFGHS